MDPVARTLQTIAAIQGETRERHVDAASTYSTEPVHSQSVSASSLSIGRDRQTAPSTKSKSDCGLEQRVEVSPTAQAKNSAAEAAYEIGLISETGLSPRPRATSHDTR
jgi:hypothetical protein